MDFQLNDDQLTLRQAARDFAQTEMTAIARELEEANEPLGRDHLKRYAEMGFLGINVAEDLGGLGLGNLEALLVLEEFAKVSPAVAFPIFESSVGPVRAIEHFAEAALAWRVVPKVCTGEMIVAVAMSEPDAGSALTDLKTKAEISGDVITLNGQKRWCSGGGHADGYVVYVRLSDDPGAKGIGAVFIEADSGGLSFGAPEQLMGFRGIPSADIFFDNVEVPVENLIVPAGGFKKLMEAFDL
ncbi:MAG: acyl-CoA dehydrogenase, partial [Alphaproteobacteria bacterium]|nr:acyl-CoA dehydrogenase [Alphaproteobacteria bacterium]